MESLGPVPRISISFWTMAEHPPMHAHKAASFLRSKFSLFIVYALFHYVLIVHCLLSIFHLPFSLFVGHLLRSKELRVGGSWARIKWALQDGRAPADAFAERCELPGFEFGVWYRLVHCSFHFPLLIFTFRFLSLLHCLLFIFQTTEVVYCLFSFFTVYFLFSTYDVCSLLVEGLRGGGLGLGVRV